MTNGEPNEPVEGETREEGQIETEQFERMTGRELFTRLIDSAEQETGIELQPLHRANTVLEWGVHLEAPSGLKVDIRIGDQIDTMSGVEAIGRYGRVDFGLRLTPLGFKEIHRAGKYEQSESYESYVAKTFDAEVSIPRGTLEQFEKGVRILGFGLKQFDITKLRSTQSQKNIENSEGYEERVRVAEKLLGRKK